MTEQSVPMLDLGYQHREVAAAVADGFARVLETNSYILGPEATRFEQEYAEYLGVAHVLGVGNGTDALELALLAAGIGAGDEVIIPANTFVATAEAVVRVGATIVLVDCGEDYLIDLRRIPDVLTSRTRAIIPVHLYGQVVDVPAIRTIVGDDVVIVEDAAQSQGARLRGMAAGGLGDVAGTSFYPGKNLGAYGDAGGVMTNSEVIAESVRALRNHGGTVRYQHDVVGTNSRLDALQAVVLSAKLARLDEWNEQRRAVADRYRDALADRSDIHLPIVGEREAHVYHQFVVEVPERDRIFEEMTAAGIGVGVHYPTPIHQLPAFEPFGLGREGDFPVAESTAKSILSLPIYPGLTVPMQDRVLEELARAVR